MALVAVLTLDLPFHCPRMGGVKRVGGMSTLRPLSAPSRLEDMDDMSSFIFSGAELHSASSSATIAGSAFEENSVATSKASIRLGEETARQLPDVQADTWEPTFDAGLIDSKNLMETAEWDIGSWVADTDKSGAGVPLRMLQAEVRLQAVQHAPAEKWKARTAERALRIYYHAKWLAERNFARAAEYRYREAAQLARSSRRSTLASHALARLGFYFLQWRRFAEAATVVEESMHLNSKSNPLASYLHGVLERRVAGGDPERLRVAESHILNAGEQPSEELELERVELVNEINYWREAEASSRHCFASADSAYMLICLLGHVATFFHQVFLK